MAESDEPVLGGGKFTLDDGELLKAFPKAFPKNCVYAQGVSYLRCFWS